jgi:hypothetical protein
LEDKLFETSFVPNCRTRPQLEFFWKNNYPINTSRTFVFRSVDENHFPE